MTVIAYKDGTIASDSLVTDDNYVRSFYMKKITKSKKGCIGGAVGNASFVTKFLEWIKKDTTKVHCPLFEFKNDMDEGIIILPNKEILYFNSISPIKINNAFIALGSAYQLAIGAMDYGANAAQAVSVAIQHSIVCGGEIHIEDL